MKKTLVILLLGTVIALATAPTLMAPEDATGIFHNPYVGAAFGTLIYDNNVPMDASTYANMVSAQNDVDCRVADDFTLAHGTAIGGVEFLGGEWNGGSEWIDWIGFDVEIFSGESGSPANPPGTPAHSVHVDWADITSSVVVFSSGSVFVSHIVVEDIGTSIALAAGNYWFSIWPYRDSGSGSLQTGMMASANATGSEVYFSSNYFGYPDWVAGNTVFGSFYDIGFAIYEHISAVEEATWGQIKAAF
ncbi:hypothetical protein K8R78_05265 [bacterium]|nr:hypothetical protein [bacterium]